MERRRSRLAVGRILVVLLPLMPCGARALDGNLCIAPASAGWAVAYDCQHELQWLLDHRGVWTTGAPCDTLPFPIGCLGYGHVAMLSLSETDPLQNTGPLDPEDPVIYLWAVCMSGLGPGLKGADFSLTGSLLPHVVGFEPLNGFTNLGTDGDYLLRTEECAWKEVVMGKLLLSEAVASDPHGIETSSWGRIRSSYR